MESLTDPVDRVVPLAFCFDYVSVRRGFGLLGPWHLPAVCARSTGPAARSGSAVRGPLGSGGRKESSGARDDMP